MLVGHCFGGGQHLMLSRRCEALWLGSGLGDSGVVRLTFVEDQREFVEHLQIGKQIGKLLDMPKRPQAQKHFFGSVI